MGASEMTYKHREALVGHIVEQQPTLRGFVRENSGDMLAGNWDFVSYSFQRGFESLWDLARTDLSGLLTRARWRDQGESRPQSSGALSAAARHTGEGRVLR